MQFHMQAVWRDDSREIFCLTRDGTLMVVAFDPGTGEVGGPSPLFSTGLPADPYREEYAVSGDGQRFLIYEAAARADADRPRISVILNWLDEL